VSESLSVLVLIIGLGVMKRRLVVNRGIRESGTESR
jgi:hypothetical protein